jgi:hypothetical protein
MGLNIKEKDGKYKLKSTISDERLHDEKWVDIDGAKKVLMERELNRFIDKIIEIDMDFPNGYMVNGKFSGMNKKFNKWILEIYEKENFQEIEDKFNEINEKYKLLENGV